MIWVNVVFVNEPSKRRLRKYDKSRELSRRIGGAFCSSRCPAWEGRLVETDSLALYVLTG